VCQKKYNRCQASYPHALSSPQFYDFLAVRASDYASADISARAFPPRAHFGLFGDYAVPHAQVAPSRQGGISLPDGLRGSPRAQAREQLDVNGLR
jgi:hypothetical protein